MDENTTSAEQSTQESTANEPQENAAGEQQEKTFSQSDIDTAVKDAVEAAQAKWKQEADEAAELAKLSKEAREKKVFENDKAKFAEDKAKFEHEKLVLETGKQLSGKSLPTDFAELLTGKDADSTLKNIEAFETAFAGAVEKAVNEKLKGKPPKVSGGDPKTTDPFLSGFTK